MDSNGWLSSLEWQLVPLIVGLLAFTAFIVTVAAVWQTRARAARRWKSLLEAYAQREIVREGRRKARRKLRTLSTPGDILPRPRAAQTYSLEPLAKRSETGAPLRPAPRAMR